MTVTDLAYKRINDFFDTYAKAIENHDTKLMAHHYAIPCTLISDDSANTYTEASSLEGLFNQAVVFFKQYGIVHARPEIWTKHCWTDKIVKVKLTWHYLDAQLAPLYSFTDKYVLRMDKNNHWKIILSVSINEKERMEEWIKKGNKKPNKSAAK